MPRVSDHGKYYNEHTEYTKCHAHSTLTSSQPKPEAHCVEPVACYPGLWLLCFILEEMPFHMWVLIFNICSTSVVETVPGPSPLTLPLTGVVNQVAKGHTGYCVCYAWCPLLDKIAPLIVPCRFREHTDWTKYSCLTQELMCWLTVQNEVAWPRRVSRISQISSLRIHTGRTERICELEVNRETDMLGYPWRTWVSIQKAAWLHFLPSRNWDGQ